jgi:hypothetical protein
VPRHTCARSSAPSVRKPTRAAATTRTDRREPPLDLDERLRDHRRCAQRLRRCWVHGREDPFMRTTGSSRCMAASARSPPASSMGRMSVPRSRSTSSSRCCAKARRVERIAASASASSREEVHVPCSSSVSIGLRSFATSARRSLLSRRRAAAARGARPLSCGEEHRRHPDRVATSGRPRWPTSRRSPGSPNIVGTALASGSVRGCAFFLKHSVTQVGLRRLRK